MMPPEHGATLRDLRNRALLALAYDTLARRSEIVAMLREDLELAYDGKGAILIRRSKTDQSREGMTRYLSRQTVRMLMAWLDAANIKEGPLFRAVLRGGRVGEALAPREVARVFKELAARAGMPDEVVKRISGHSTRVGAAQDMASEEGFEMPAIMQAGGWKSAQMVASYVANQTVRRSAAARLAKLQNRD
jgi:integrase